MAHRIKLWRWQWTWRKYRALREHGVSLGLTPRPPDEHYRGETVRRFGERLALLMEKHSAAAALMTGDIWDAFAHAYGFSLPSEHGFDQLADELKAEQR
jgi:hypothetical protein